MFFSYNNRIRFARLPSSCNVLDDICEVDRSNGETMGILTMRPKKHRLLRAKHDAIKIIWAWRRPYRQGVLKLMGPKIIQSYNVCFRRVSPIMEGWHLQANLRHTTLFLRFFGLRIEFEINLYPANNGDKHVFYQLTTNARYISF